MGLFRRLLIAVTTAVLLSLLYRQQNGLTFSPPIRLSFWVLHGSPTSTPRPTGTPTPTATPSPTPSPTPTPTPLDARTTVLAYPPPPIQARAAILEDLATGRVLFARSPDQRLAMASTTKITTAVLALQRGHLDDLVRVSHAAAAIGESTMSLRTGERVTVRQLLYGLMLNSGNDAAIALAEHVGGTQRHFVAMMNRLARSLGMRHTHYVTPHGLDEPGHFSSARDLATMARYAMRDPTFRRIVATESYYVPRTRHNHEHWLANINRVMYWYPGINGVKPGDTDAAGMCQVVTVHRDGHDLLAVLLNTPTLVTDIRNLLNYGLHDFRWVQAPAWWDTPANTLTGGHGSDRWLYYLGAGHFIRGPFLSYFEQHGGLRTLGYPRTEQLPDRGRVVQYFQGAVLAFDGNHVYPEPIGVAEARSLGVALRRSVRVASSLHPLYHLLGERKVLGWPVTRVTRRHGYTLQFFQNGVLARAGGAAYVVPAGDALLWKKGWLPAAGAADAYPTSMVPALTDALTP